MSDKADVHGDTDDPGHEQIRGSLGAWLTGRADETERWLVEQHLRRCSDCREESTALRPVVSLLAQVDLDELDAPAELPRDLQERTFASVTPHVSESAAAAAADEPRADDARPPAPPVDELAAHRESTRPEEWSPSLRRPPRRAAAEPAGRATSAPRPRRGSRLLATAAAAVLLLVAVGAGIAAGRASVDTSPPRPVTAEDLALQVRSEGVDGTGEVIAHTWGVEVKLAVTGLEQGAGYTAEVIDAAGEPVDAGGFVGTGNAETRCNLNAALLRDQASGFAVRDAEGDVVLQAAL